MTSSGATAQSVAVSGTVSSGTTGAIASTLYLLTPASSGSAGTLAAQAGVGAQTVTIPSAGGINHDGTPTNAIVFLARGLTGTYNPGQQTQFALFVDSGTNVADGTQVRISYDFTGDGTFDRVETYRYFAEDNRAGWETYTQSAGLKSASGSFANLTNGSVKVEVWDAIGGTAVSLRTSASATDGLQSRILIPFAASSSSLAPTLAVSPTALALGATTQGAPGSVQTFTVSGSRLRASLVVTAPPRVEVSRDGVNFGSTISLTPDATGMVPTTTVDVRIAASAPAATMSGSIAVTSWGRAGGGCRHGHRQAALPFSNTLYFLGAPRDAEHASRHWAHKATRSLGRRHQSRRAPINARVYQINGLTGTYDPTSADPVLPLRRAGTQGCQRHTDPISYDFNGDGIFDRIETHCYLRKITVSAGRPTRRMPA